MKTLDTFRKVQINLRLLDAIKNCALPKLKLEGNKVESVGERLNSFRGTQTLIYSTQKVLELFLIEKYLDSYFVADVTTNKLTC